MTQSESQTETPIQHDEAMAELSEYRSVNFCAIAALFVGLVSALALVHPLLWAVPLLAVALSTVGLAQISSSRGEQVGRKLALAGLAIALIFGSAAVSKRFVFQWAVQREASDYSQLWFNLLASGEPHKAHQLVNSPVARQSLDSDLWEHYRETPEARTSLSGFVEQPLIRALLDLGSQVEVTLIASASATGKGKTVVDQIYAVSFETPDGRKTMFCQLRLARTRDDAAEFAQWQLTDFQGAISSPYLE